MTVAAQISDVVQNPGQAMRSKQFVHYARYLMLGKGGSGAALALAEGAHAVPEITRIFKSAISAGSTSNTPLAEYETLATAFIGSLGQASAFEGCCRK